MDTVVQVDLNETISAESGLRSFDATAHEIVVHRVIQFREDFSFVRRSGSHVGFKMADIGKGWSGYPVTAGGRIFIANSPNSDLNMNDGKLVVREIDPDSRAMVDRGEGMGSVVAAMHDRYGAYWLSYDATSWYLWVLDFEFLGCPAD